MSADDRQRGPHPDDARDFAPAHHAAMRGAVADLSWLLTRGYSDKAALKLVCDRHQLTRRQRLAVAHAACPDASLKARDEKHLPPRSLSDRSLRIDGFNVIITLEAAWSGALIVIGRDGVRRDLSRVRGSYRQVAHTRRAIEAVGALLAEHHLAEAEWCLDRPVSNSGRLRDTILEVAAERRWAWTVALTERTDHEVAAGPDAVASSDGWILDAARCFVDVAGEVIMSQIPNAWTLDLRGG